MSYHRLRLLLVTKRDHWERHFCFNLVKDQLSWELAVSQTMQILTRLWIFQFHPLLRLLRGSRATGCFGYEVTLNPNYHQILVKCFFYNVKIQNISFGHIALSFFRPSMPCVVLYPLFQSCLAFANLVCPLASTKEIEAVSSHSTLMFSKVRFPPNSRSRLLY